MTVDQYQDWTSTIWLSGNSEKGISLAAIGLAGEYGEVLEVIEKYLTTTNNPFDKENFIKEMGDFRYYEAQLLKQFDIKMSELEVLDDESGVIVDTIRLGLNVGKALEVAKKHLRDGKFDRPKFLKFMSKVDTHFAALASTFKTSVEEIQNTNFQKLEDRKSRNVLHGAGDNR